MKICKIASRVSGIYDNLLSDSEVLTINNELMNVKGGDRILDILKSHGLSYKEKPGIYKTVFYKDLGNELPLRNLNLKIVDGVGTLLHKKKAAPFDNEKMERAVGPFTRDFDD